MNKALIILILYVLNFSFAAIGTTAARWSWENCQDQLKAYADKYDTLTQDQKNAEDKAFDCAQDYVTSAQREKCESANSLSSLTDPQKTFYNDCYKPYQDYVNSQYEDRKADCASERDADKVCNDDTNCKSFAKGNQEATKQADFTAISNSVDTAKPKCSKIASNCADSLKNPALAGCQSYEKNACLATWMETNAATDTGYLLQMCTSSITVYGVIAKFSAILLLAFFTL